jgi:predicted TIM-barrel fold metal-dependent hydrolase
MTKPEIISADSHVQEPPELFEKWIPSKYRDKIPRVEERDGGRYIVFDGMRPRRLDVAEKEVTEDDENREFRSDDEGGRNIDRRLKDLERDGVTKEVIYPNSSLMLYCADDAGYQFAIARAYNDWCIDLFGANGKPFTPVGIVPVRDIALAVKEVERIAKLGYRSIKVPISVRDKPYNLPDYDPLWSAINDAGMVLSLHAFAESEDRYPADWGEKTGIGGALNHMAMSMVEGMSPVSLLIASGALQRYPDMKFVVVECGAGWLAWLLYLLDEQAEKKHMWVKPKLDLKPSEYFKRQGAVTFSDDPIALHNIKFTGADGLLWGSDYPHDEGTFPHSQSVIERTFKDISETDKRKIVYDNAARMYGL